MIRLAKKQLLLLHELITETGGTVGIRNELAARKIGFKELLQWVLAHEQ